MNIQIIGIFLVIFEEAACTFLVWMNSPGVFEVTGNPHSSQIEFSINFIFESDFLFCSFDCYAFQGIFYELAPIFIST